MMYVFGTLGLFVVPGLLVGTAYHPPFNRLFRQLGSALLVATEFSYDQTCAASSQTRFVAPLKDRKELKVSNVLIADVTSWTTIQFSLGHCE
jgi:hypothetical protein